MRILGGVILALAVSGAARAIPLDGLEPEFRKACQSPDENLHGPALSAGRTGVISVADARKALLKVYAFDAGLLLEQSPASLTERALSADEGASGDDGKLANLALMIDQWRTSPTAGDFPLRDGGLYILAATPGQATPDTEVVLLDLLSGRNDRILIYCHDPEPALPLPPRTAPAGGPPAPSDGRAPPPPPKFVLVKTVADLGQSDIAKKSFGEFSYSDDRETRVQSYGVSFAAGLRWRVREHGDQQTWLFRWKPAAYVAYDRKGDNDPETDSYTNNLNFGGQLVGDLQLKPVRQTMLGYYALSAQFETDDDFASRAYSAELRLDPPLPRLPGRRVFRKIPSPTATDVDAIWSADLVADWSQVDDPGDKTALKDKAEYVRVGYDAGFKLRMGLHNRDWRLVWSVLYQLRDGQTNDGGDAQLFSSNLMFALSKETNYAFGLSYERGENLQSFNQSELWKLVLGVRY